ncbi:MAG: glycosyltransferase [Methylomarinum sp.]|nr:glycosyltransferase [Methylomarinum sp.]
MIFSPMATGNGAYILHKNIEHYINDYKVLPYNPYKTLFPPILFPIGRFNRADIIHTTPDYGIFHKRRDVPLILTFHNYVLDRFMRQYSSPLQSIHYMTDLRWFTSLSISQACQLTAVSHFTANLAKQSLGLKDDIQVIYNGIDQKKFFPKKKRNNKEVNVLFCGNLTKRKGAHWLESIADRLSSNISIQYTEGLRGMGATLSHLKLKSIGRVKYQNMSEVYNQADILLFPTVREGLSLAALEAMACGLPVVASNCSSMPELIDEGKGGFLCSVGDVDAIAEKLNLLADNAPLRKEMGEYNRVKVESQFALDRMINEYKNLFIKTLDER